MAGFCDCVSVVFDGERKCMEAGGVVRRGEAENVVVGNVIGQRDQAGLEIFGIVKARKPSSRKLGQRLGSVGTQTVASREKGHGRETKRRSELADAVEHVLAVV